MFSPRPFNAVPDFTSSGSLAMLAAMRRNSSLVSSWPRRGVLLFEMDERERLPEPRLGRRGAVWPPRRSRPSRP